MVSVALRISDEFKSVIDKLPWVNWSEIAREEFVRQEKLAEALETVQTIVSASAFTEQDAKELADKVKKSMHDQLVKEGLI